MMETYYGHVRTPADAIKLFEACRLGLLPRVQRRLSEKERQSIRSGSVFVWDEREAGMRRWTDGKSWSASRVSGSFLTYREMEGKRGGGNFVPNPRRGAGKTPDSGRGSDEDGDNDQEGPDGYRYKPDGLMKQSFSITASTGQHLHLISYYSRPTNGQELLQPTQDPALRHIVPMKGMYPESTVHDQSQGPGMNRALIQGGNYIPHASPQPIHGSPLQATRPPYPYQVGQGYNWPPSPASTPPYSYPAYSAQAPPTSQPATHGSPHQYSPSQSLPPSAYDRSPHEATLPPPMPHALMQRSVTSAGPQGVMPVYAPNPSPRVAQARLIAEQQQQQQQQQAQHAAQLALKHTQTNTAAAPSVADPRSVTVTSLVSGYPPAPTVNGRGHHTPPLPQIQSAALSRSPLVIKQELKAGATSTQTIPSISTLVNGRDGDHINGAGSRSASHSPRGTRADGPKDIPHDKLNFGEDMRALSVLNRKFCL